MIRNLILAGVIAALIPASSQAWGARHVGYTHVGYGGVQHYGYTTAHAPYAYGYHPGGYHPYPYNAMYPYSPAQQRYISSNAYHHGAVNPAGYAKAAGVYRK